MVQKRERRLVLLMGFQRDLHLVRQMVLPMEKNLGPQRVMH